METLMHGWYSEERDLTHTATSLFNANGEHVDVHFVSDRELELPVLQGVYSDVVYVGKVAVPSTFIFDHNSDALFNNEVRKAVMMEAPVVSHPGRCYPSIGAAMSVYTVLEPESSGLTKQQPKHNFDHRGRRKKQGKAYWS